ncbi:ATP-binding cassette domain-containing protein [Lapidilactobacillus salsurivasis]
MKLDVTNLAKSFRQQPILKQIDFSWTNQEIIGLVGRNGAGKTTLLNCLTNDYQPDQGGIFLDEVGLMEKPELRQHLVAVDPQHPFFQSERLTAISDYYQLAYPNFDGQQLQKYWLGNQIERNKQYREFSKGQQAYICITLAICCRAEFVILDEPFDGLDLIVRDKIVRLIIANSTKYHCGFLIASHNLNELDGLCDRALFLNNGRITQDYALEATRTQSRKFQLVFRQQQIPALVYERGKILTVRGRVLEVVFTNYDDGLAADLAALEPVLCEELPLELTDLFKAEYQSTSTRKKVLA